MQHQKYNYKARHNKANIFLDIDLIDMHQDIFFLVLSCKKIKFFVASFNCLLMKVIS